jgi:SAM-dependent methyltransferase
MARKRRTTHTFTARTADKYALYQAAVQEPDADLDFLDRMFARHSARKPARIREDFCGTAYLAARWVARRPGNTALGVDLDPKPLAWGRRHILPTLTPDQLARLRLMRTDVRADAPRRAGPFDAVFALNFSYWIFRQRADLLAYFHAARRALAKDGLFILDFFGGSDVLRELVERTRKEGFTYVWDQHRYDPISGDLTCHIDFEFKDGSRLPRAFTYHWRLWTIPELRDILREAGFANVDVYMEGEDQHGHDTGHYVRRTSSPSDRCIVPYIVAS